jgi:hypothetical protein
VKLFFAGAENSEWRKFLAEEDISNVSMSFVKLCDRVKFARPWTIADHFPDSQHVLLDAGGYSYNKEDSGVTEDQAMEMANKYMAFVADNIDAVELVTEFDANILGNDWLEGMREDFYDDLPDDKFIPVWHADSGQAGLERLASRYEHVGVLKSGVDDRSVPLLNGLVNRYGVKLHGLGIADWQLIKAIKWDSVSSGSWIKPSQFGETIIWDGHELKRYPMKYKDQARNRHRSYIDSQGFDAQKIIDDDRHEVLRLSVWSWTEFMASIEHHRVMQPFGGGSGVTPPLDTPDEENAERGSEGVDTLPPGSRNDRLLPAVPVTRPLKLIPILGVETISGKNEDGEDVEERVMHAPSKSLLRCDSCEIRDMCPEFSQGSECAFEFPAYVRTKNQMRALQDWLIQHQTQRVQRMMMIEQIKGGYADANLSAEEDRLQRMIKAKQDAEREGFSLHIQASSSGEMGAISRLFGKEVGDEATSLPHVISTSEIMRNSDIVDAEIVEG